MYAIAGLEDGGGDASKKRKKEQAAVLTFRHCAYSLVSRFMHWCSGSSQQRDSRQLSSYALAQRAAIVCTQCDSRFVSAACTGGSCVQIPTRTRTVSVP